MCPGIHILIIIFGSGDPDPHQEQAALYSTRDTLIKSHDIHG